jgi:hypothetical protein
MKRTAGLILGVTVWLCVAVPALGASWHVVASPNVNSATQSNQLWDVSASSAVNVWAVGRHGSAPLILRWNGSGWAKIAAPSGMDYVGHVLAFSRSSVWISGSLSLGGTAFAHWNGSAWRVRPTATGDVPGEMDPVSATQIWSVSTNDNGDCTIFRWNGFKWLETVNPDCPVGAGGTDPIDVAAISAHDVWTLVEPFGGGYDIAETTHWNGTTWKSIYGVGNVGGGFDNVGTGISASSSTNVWAVGHTNNADDLGTPPGERFSWASRWSAATKSWSTRALPNFNLPHRLMDVAAATRTSVWAVGERANASGALRTYTVHWNGSSWADLGGPNPGVASDALASVSVVPGTAANVWAVGAYSSGTHTRTLVLHWH